MSGEAQIHTYCCSLDTFGSMKYYAHFGCVIDTKKHNITCLLCFLVSSQYRFKSLPVWTLVGSLIPRFQFCILITFPKGSHAVLLKVLMGFQCSQSVLNMFPKATIGNNIMNTANQKWSPPTWALLGPLLNIGNNLKNITTYLCKAHFNVTIGDALIY